MSRNPEVQWRDVGKDQSRTAPQALELVPEIQRDQLRETIDRCAADRPSVSELIQKLERAGVRAIPSIQQSGRLNGLTYEIDGRRIKGSSLGRAYTASGLQHRKCVRYDPALENPYLQTLAWQDRGVRGIHDPFEIPRSQARDRERGPRGLEGIDVRQRETLREIGCFRALRTRDLVQVRYRGDIGAWHRDLRVLKERALLEQGSIVVKGHRGRPKSLTIVVLTKKGKELLKRAETNPERKVQALYAGFVKPREITHDTAIYRLYQVEAARVEREGGRVRRVVLDYELKKKVFAPLVKARKESPLAYARKQAEVARQNGLRVVNGHVPLPDLRIEYDNARGERTKVDLELATADYRGEHLRTKERAGFRVFMEGSLGSGTGSQARYSPEDEDHLEAILSF